jgi:RNA-directed DNA polymerase
VWEEPVTKPKSKVESFVISKGVVWEAWEQVRANQGAAGVDEESVTEFERDLKGNLYKVWDRMSSGTYMPPAVRVVQIPKRDEHGVITLGVPTVADSVAQTVVKLYLEPGVEPLFYPDSYGYRPGRSALDAVGVRRERCWRSDWVIDLDLRSFFDSLDHELMLQTVAVHTKERWVPLYVERWLKAPVDAGSGTLVVRDRGTLQGSVISPVLAGVFLHYAFDAWMAWVFPAILFERYADDIVVHCISEHQARFVLGKIARRLADARLELNLGKIRIVCCMDSNREGSHEHERFDFLGFTFRSRRSRNGRGEMFASFSPAMSNEAGQGDTSNNQALEAAPMERENPHGPRTVLQSDRARMDQPLRDVCPVPAQSIALGHRQILGALGDTKVQTTKGQQQEGMDTPARRGNTRAGALCSLAAGTNPRPDGGSRMTGDRHVRFCESRRAQSLQPLTKDKKKARGKKARGKKARGRKVISPVGREGK